MFATNGFIVVVIMMALDDGGWGCGSDVPELLLCIRCM